VKCNECKLVILIFSLRDCKRFRFAVISSDMNQGNRYVDQWFRCCGGGDVFLSYLQTSHGGHETESTVFFCWNFFITRPSYPAVSTTELCV